MPTLKEYDAPVDKLTPQTGGEEAYAMEGRRVGQFYHQMGQDLGGAVQGLGEQYVQHQTDEEKRQIITSSVALENNLHDGWQTYANNPTNANNPAAASTYMQQAQQQIQDWSAHATTREGKLLATERASEMEQHLFERTSADQSTMTATHAATQAQQTMQGIVGMTARDPSSADANAGLIRRAVETLVPTTIDPGVRAKVVDGLTTPGLRDNAIAYYQNSLEAVRRDYAGGATTSAAEDQLRKDLASGKYSQDLAGAGEESFAKLLPQVDAAVHEGTDIFHQRQEWDQRQQVMAGDQAAISITDKAITELIITGSTSPETQAAITRYGKDYPHNFSQAEGLERFRMTAARDELHRTFVHSDGDTLTTFWGRAGLAPGDPNALKSTDVLDAIHSGKLSNEDGQLLIRDISAETHQARGSGSQIGTWRSQLMRFYSTLRSQVVGGSQDTSGLGLGSGPDPVGSMVYGDMVRNGVLAFQNLVAQGKNPQEAYTSLTGTGPDGIVAHLPYYLAAKASGQPEDFEATHPNRDAFVAGQPAPAAQPAASANTARQPGESPDAYLRRMGM